MSSQDAFYCSSVKVDKNLAQEFDLLKFPQERGAFTVLFKKKLYIYLIRVVMCDDHDRSFVKLAC